MLFDTVIHTITISLPDQSMFTPLLGILISLGLWKVIVVIFKMLRG
jgi:hypothetical protein